MQRLERELERLSRREHELHERMAAAASDHAQLHELSAQLDAVKSETASKEADWLAVAEELEA